MVWTRPILPGPKMTTSWTGVSKVIREVMKDGKHRELLAIGKTGTYTGSVKTFIIYLYSVHKLLNLQFRETTLMPYSHYAGPRPGQVHGMGLGVMGPNTEMFTLVRNRHRNQIHCLLLCQSRSLSQAPVLCSVNKPLLVIPGFNLHHLVVQHFAQFK